MPERIFFQEKISYFAGSMDKLDIGIEISGALTNQPTGIAKYIRFLVRELRRREEIFLTPYYKFSKRKNLGKNFSFEGLTNFEWHYHGLYNPFKKIELAHTTDSALLDIRRAKKIITIHDLAIFRPETNIPGYTSPGFRKKAYAKLKNFSEKADGIITVSRQTKLDFLELFPDFPDEKIRPIYLSRCLPDSTANEEKILSEHQLEKKKYFLFVGHLSIRKNLLNIIRAFHQSGLHQEYKLVLAGAPSMGFDEIEKEISFLNLEKKIFILNYVPDESLPALYKNSLGLVFPTYYEGFGIPILEAMHFGAPALIGNIGAAPEIFGAHAVSASPFSVEEISSGIEKLLSVSDEKISSAQKFSQGFSWHKNAEETVDFYKEILGR